MSDRMVQTAFRLPQELLEALDKKLTQINDNDPLQRNMNRSMFVRAALTNALKEKNDE